MQSLPRSLTTPMLERAWRVSARAHAGQTRKATDLPYIIHPAAVALILTQAGFTDDITLTAALLHDVVEDTAVTIDDLLATFPAEVIDLVRDLSEQKTEADGTPRSWIDRKTEHLERLQKAPVASRAIFLADRRHNIESIVFDLQDGVDIWSRFNAPRIAILKQYRQAIEATRHGDPRLEQLAEECLQIVNELESVLASAS